MGRLRAAVSRVCGRVPSRTLPGSACPVQEAGLWLGAPSVFFVRATDRGPDTECSGLSPLRSLKVKRPSTADRSRGVSRRST
eukprot:1981884-Prymnesium_polylepis.1